MVTLTQQLNAAFEESGWSVAELLAKTGLPIDRSSLSRKLKGELRMNTDEAETIASALGVTISWPERAGRKRVAA